MAEPDEIATPDGGGESRLPEWDEAGSWLDNLARPELGPVSWLGELAPSGRLMTELEGLPADLVENDYDAVEMVAHWKRLESYAALRVRLAAAALARRQSMAHGLAALAEIREAEGRGGVAVDTSVAADELGVRLGVSRLTAKRLIASGQAMVGPGLPTGEALAAGDIDASKADVILDAVADLGPEAALEVQERVLDRAGHLPPSVVRREVNAACAGVDVAEFEERCRAERAKRRVCRPRALPHGMAGLYAVLPAVEASQLYRALDAAARSAKASGDVRTMDQLRADSLSLMGSMAVRTGWIGPPAEPCAPHPGGAEVPTAGLSHVQVQRPSTADDTGRSRPPRRRSGRATHPSRPADPPRTPDARGEVCPPSMRVGVIGGRSAHVRVVVPMTVLMEGPRMAPEAHVSSVGGQGPPGAAQSAAVAGQDPPTGAQDPPTGAGVPAYLDGYGPIPGSVARALAAGSTWARLVTDPVDGSVRELSAPSYRPPPALADLVRAERPMCIRPGCSVEADSCDLNHNPPWPIGSTEFDDLDPACRRDHELLTHAGWWYEDVVDEAPGSGSAQPGPASRRWTTGSGHVYTERPGGPIGMTGPRAVGPARSDRDESPIRRGLETWGAPPY